MKQQQELADSKMEEVAKGQAEAVKRQDESMQLKVSLEESKVRIKERRKLVEEDLAKVEPELLAAKKLVSEIKRAHLDELRTMGTPPAGVKITMEAVTIMVKGYDSSVMISWDMVRRELRDQSFIPNVLNFDSDMLRPETRDRVQAEYLDDPSWDYDRILHASRAAGPLAAWVESQFKYARMVKAVQPLRSEISMLEKDAVKVEEHVLHNDQVVMHLSEAIAKGKTEYAELVAMTQQIRKEMESIQGKVLRSTNLLKVLFSTKSSFSHVFCPRM